VVADDEPEIGAVSRPLRLSPQDGPVHYAVHRPLDLVVVGDCRRYSRRLLGLDGRHPLADPFKGRSR